MRTIEDLKKELKGLQFKREEEATIKKLKRQIKGEKFAQSKGGKFFNRIADVGDAVFSKTKATTQKGKKKKTSTRLSVEEVMKRLPK